MSSNRRLYLILGMIALLIVLVISVMFEYRKVSDADWAERSYSLESKEPYGMWLLRALTEKYYNTAEHIDGLPTDQKEHSLYIRVADRGSMLPERTDSLLQFVKEGNDAFIIANTFAGTLDTLISGYYYNYQVWDQETTRLSMSDDSTTSYAVAYFNHELDTLEHSPPPQGFYEDFYEGDYNGDIAPIVNYTDTESLAIIAVPYGNEGGKIYLCAAPLVLSNIALQQEQMLAFYTRLMPVFKTPAVVYWDDAAGVFIRNAHSDSPLKYILSEPSLRLAYYLLLSLGLLFMLFRSRRRQKQIPIKIANKNTSLGYIDTLSKLYQQDDNHNKLVQHIEKIFYHNVEQAYFVRKEHPDFVSVLAKKARQSEEQVEKLLTRFASAKAGEAISTYQLQKLTERVDSILDTKTKK